MESLVICVYYCNWINCPTVQGTWKEQLKQKFRNGRRPDSDQSSSREQDERDEEHEVLPRQPPKKQKKKGNRVDSVDSESMSVACSVINSSPPLTLCHFLYPSPTSSFPPSIPCYFSSLPLTNEPLQIRTCSFLMCIIWNSTAVHLFC